MAVTCVWGHVVNITISRYHIPMPTISTVVVLGIILLLLLLLLMLLLMMSMLLLLLVVPIVR